MENRKIIGFENYLIDEFGLIISLTKKYNSRNLKQQTNRCGYKVVYLYANNQRYFKYIHRLVAENFLDEYIDNLEINHKDCNKENNHFSNLEIVTRKENMIHASKNGLLKRGKSQIERARQLGLSWGKINGCKVKYDSVFIDKIIMLRNIKKSYNQIAKELGCSASTAERLFKGVKNVNL